jgi:prepilin-type processing-associated H-X9-DG protein
MKSWQLFQCPSALSTKPKTTDYFYNSRVAIVDEKKFAFYAETILAGDGTNDSSTNYALSNLPANWPNDPKSPANRHLDGANYLFVDGHVKFFSPANLKAPLSWNP